MKSTKLFSAITLSAAILGTVVTTISASADSKDYTSQGQIEFKASEESTSPKDPTDPGKEVDPKTPIVPVNPIDPDQPVAPGTAGPLSIDFASSFNFGEQKISSKDEVYFAGAQVLKQGAATKEVPNYVQVTDNRGTLAGWSLSVTQSEFKTADGAKLDGAQITLGEGHIVSASEKPADKAAASTVLVPGVASSEILGASKDNGAGTNILAFGDDASKATAVSLKVPGKSTKLAQKYTADLVWTLVDTPANN